MYPNEGAVDTTAVKMSQMVGVFLAGLGLAAVTMRPATLDASDLVVIRDNINTSISGLQGSIDKVNASVSKTNTEVRSLTTTLSDLDLGVVTKAADAVLLASQQLQANATNLQSLIEGLDLSVEVDLDPVLSQILGTHATEMQGISDILRQINGLNASNAAQWNTVRDDLVAKLITDHESVSQQIAGLMDQLSELDVEVDLTPVLNATEQVRAVAQQHSSNFDSFVNALIG